MFCSHVGENCWGNSISIHVESKISRHGKDQRLQSLHGMSARCRPAFTCSTFAACRPACRPCYSNIKHYVCRFANRMSAGCRLDVGWMSASVGHEISSAAISCSLQTENPTMRSMRQCGGAAWMLISPSRTNKTAQSPKKAAAKVIHVLKNT